MTNLTITCWFTGALAVAGTVVACGSSSSSGLSCGPGTAAHDGECVVLDGAADSGSYDVTQADVAVEEAHVDTGAPDVVDSSAPSDASQEHTTWVDDPCPDVSRAGTWINCANDCGGLRGCSVVKCGSYFDGGTVFELSSQYDVPLIIRMPSNPGVDPDCAGTCGTKIDYGVEVLMNLPYSFTNNVLATMNGASPWQMSNGIDGYCPAGPQSVGCEELSASSGQLLVWTNDPTAPARNVTVTADPNLLGCRDQ
jgi:hypothetical protein